MLASLAACGPSRPPEHEARDEQARTGGALPVFPLRITMPGEEGVLEVTGDGAILADGDVKARFRGDEVVDAKGHLIVHVASDGTIEVKPPPGAAASHVVEKGARFDEHDDVIIDDGGGVTIGDDATVTYHIAHGEPKKAPLKIEGWKREAKREVAVLFILLTLPSNAPPPAPPGAPPMNPPGAPPAPPNAVPPPPPH